MAEQQAGTDDYPIASDADDLIYKWTIRTLYMVAIGLNIWIMWDQLDGTEAERVRRKVTDTWHKAIAPLKEQRVFARSLNKVLYQATEIVEETASDEAA